jgi:hypothetical protein
MRCWPGSSAPMADRRQCCSIASMRSDSDISFARCRWPSPRRALRCRPAERRSIPDGTSVPDGVRVVNLPPLGHDSNFDLVSHDPRCRWTSTRERPRLILDELAITQPAAVLIELFPFGRKKFEFELLPLLDACTRWASNARGGVQRPHIRSAGAATGATRPAGIAVGQPLLRRHPRALRPEVRQARGHVPSRDPDDGADPLHGIRHQQRQADRDRTTGSFATSVGLRRRRHGRWPTVQDGRRRPSPLA